MNNKIKVWVYRLTDCQGNQRLDVLSDCSENLTVGGYDKDGKYQQYDSYEAYHAYGWAQKHGFRLECATFEKDVSELKFE